MASEMLFTITTQSLLLKLLQSNCSFLEIWTMLILLTPMKQIVCVSTKQLAKGAVTNSESGATGPSLSQGNFSVYSGMRCLDYEGWQKHLTYHFCMSSSLGE